jgi:hypothetical protein
MQQFTVHELIEIYNTLHNASIVRPSERLTKALVHLENQICITIEGIKPSNPELNKAVDEFIKTFDKFNEK